jgi:hypothetical protein
MLVRRFHAVVSLEVFRRERVGGRGAASSEHPTCAYLSRPPLLLQSDGRWRAGALHHHRRPYPAHRTLRVASRHGSPPQCCVGLHHTSTALHAARFATPAPPLSHDGSPFPGLQATPQQCGFVPRPRGKSLSRPLSRREPLNRPIRSPAVHPPNSAPRRHGVAAVGGGHVSVELRGRQLPLRRGGFGRFGLAAVAAAAWGPAHAGARSLMRSRPTVTNPGPSVSANHLTHVQRWKSCES